MTTVARGAAGLTDWIDSQSGLMHAGWLEGLDPRKREEAEFHDADRAEHRDEVAESTPNRRFYEAADVVRNHIDDWIRTHTRDAVFLDYACGNGAMSLKAAEAGAALTVGIDISEVSVRNARENAEARGFGRTTRFLQRDCEDTGFPNGAFNAILCSGMLHHLDLHRAFPELHRILAPGGRILCIEALSYNPVIQAYRNRTPELRTAWEKEHILGMKDVRLARRWFDVQNLSFHLLTAPLATLLPTGIARRSALAIGHAVDAALTKVPLLRLWSWQFTFELVRRD